MNYKKIILFAMIFSLIVSVGFAQDHAEEFKNKNGKEWFVEMTPEGIIFFAYKTRPDERGSPLSRDKAIEAAKGFLDDNSEIIGLGNFVNIYDELKQSNYFSYWVIDFDGEIIRGIMPPHMYVRIFMSRDGQVYAIGDLDSFTLRTMALFQRDEIPETKAIEEAKKSIGSDTKPVETKLMSNVKINDTDYPFVWDIKFGDPDNKEVLVDAKTGEILSTKPIKPPLKLGALGQLLSNPFVMIALSLVVIGIIFITFFFIERIRKVREGEKKLEGNQLLLKN